MVSRGMQILTLPADDIVVVPVRITLASTRERVCAICQKPWALVVKLIKFCPSRCSTLPPSLSLPVLHVCAGFHIRMGNSFQDMVWGVNVSLREGLNKNLRDCTAFCAADPNVIVVGVLNGRPISCVTGAAYSKAYGYMGLYMVSRWIAVVPGAFGTPDEHATFPLEPVALSLSIYHSA